jgi:molybdate transport system regulatory protein
MRLFIRCVEGEVRLGPGKIRLLELIGDHGSISEAARAMEMSYRRAWLLVAELNQSFRRPVTSARTGGKGGGHAELTEFGHELVRRYRAIERDAAAAVAGQMDELAAELALAAGKPEGDGAKG